ncbi:putative Zn finger-like uncharacterized protein [Luteibacter sp. Sphag1AF]|uniref:zinc-ribbon and DUF3426 domain-containing protein n=1 Tax=Luteibacter sp. Sphag1AF TaxID=2587031 RepID=UPI00179E4079|nr:zinc-ribbon and DUF3426 domain-containing protein [Luteibacter sp. Sphag1AF]MBB3226126.1 putative Zn finger-like uncharacterized protein [Luteibacter sp. Sphag1AF]
MTPASGYNRRMYTQCPECLTVYKLDAALLVPACGCVRCSHCSGVFNALGTLAEQLPPEPFSLLPVHDLDSEPPALDIAVFRPKPAAPEPVEQPTVAAVPAADEPTEDFSELVFTPKFARRRRRSWQAFTWTAICTVLLVGLGGQLAWAKRDTLIADTTFGPWLQWTCDTLGCDLPLVSDIHRLRMLARDVEAHPSVPDGLLITASVRNDAPFAQPYPTVTITLADTDGKRLAMRRFAPADYVTDASARSRGMRAGATSAMVFEVQDPGQKAVAFEFAFE